ncbi:MAG TPA: amidohydrolase family protein [Methylomirabilota bacterium]|jgi:predicted TIM-barrel fold metal-dependent hydrolase|nr:amidohydrolase family protein [Methylomirabilota bacterium]
MSSNGHLTAAAIRARLRHPIIDADGHWLEFGPLVCEQLKKIGGECAVEGFSLFRSQVVKELSMSVAERRAQRIAQQAFWALPTKNTRDRATAMMPRLLYERLEELGIDFTVLYPTAGLGIPRISDAELRRITCRAFNIFTADFFRPFADRMTPAAVIPMHTPDEAIEELEYVTKQLGLKVVMLWSMIRRPIPAFADTQAEAAKRAVWYDPLGIDSEYDYDSVWAKCLELGVSPTFHTGSRGYGLRISPTNFVYNHIGHFAAAHEAVSKALFLGGVTRRFPRLKFAFLEGGVGWACQLYADLIGHWEKRNREALEEVDPKNLHYALLLELAKAYGPPGMADSLRRREDVLDTATFPQGPSAVGGIADLDDYSACGIKRPEDLHDLFVDSFYFGCEADDRMNAWAFNRRHNPCNAQLNALFGSDIGHFDVQDMAQVVPEAYELVEDGLISEEGFRDFMFTNPVRFWGEANPDFFRGTVVEKEAAALLSTTGKASEQGVQLSA